MNDLFNKDLIEILINMRELKVNKDWILKNIDNFDLTKGNLDYPDPLFFIVSRNKFHNLGFTKKNILDILDKFDLNSVDYYGNNTLIHIIIQNKWNKLDFNKEDLLNILDKFDLKQKYNNGRNALMFIISYNEVSNLGFNQDDILSILDRFDFNQKCNYRKSVYDYTINGKIVFDDKSLSLLISKLDIKMTDINNKNILIKELKRGLCFNSDELVQKILNTENEEIINCVYEHIEQIKWKQEELFLFLSKNNLKLKDDIVNII